MKKRFVIQVLFVVALLMLALPIHAQEGGAISETNLGDLTETRIDFENASFFVSPTFSPDGRLLALTGAGSETNATVIWDILNGEEVGHIEGITLYPPTFSADGMWMALVFENDIAVYQFPNYESAVARFGADDSLRNPQFSADNMIFYATDLDATVLWWTALAVVNCKTWESGFDCDDTQIDMIDTATGTVQSIDGLIGLPRVGFSQDGRRFWFQNAPSGNLVAYSYPELEQLIVEQGYEIVISANGAIAFLSDNEQLRVVDIATGASLMKLLEDASPTYGMALSPNGDALVVVAETDDGLMFASIFTAP